MEIRLHNGSLCKTLLLHKGVKLSREILMGKGTCYLACKSVHLTTKDTVESCWVDFGTCGLPRAVMLTPDETIVSTGTMTTPSKAARQQQPVANIWKANEQQRRWFFGSCSDYALVKADDGATL